MFVAENLNNVAVYNSIMQNNSNIKTLLSISLYKVLLILNLLYVVNIY